MKLGLSERASMSTNFFYNDFVSKILFNPEDNPEVSEEELACRLQLEKVAIVDVAFTEADAIVLTQRLRQKIPLITAIGGLLSLFAGFSFLSLSELLLWLALPPLRYCRECILRLLKH